MHNSPKAHIVLEQKEGRRIEETVAACQLGCRGIVHCMRPTASSMGKEVKASMAPTSAVRFLIRPPHILISKYVTYE